MISGSFKRPFLSKSPSILGINHQHGQQAYILSSHPGTVTGLDLDLGCYWTDWQARPVQGRYPFPPPPSSRIGRFWPNMARRQWRENWAFTWAFFCFPLFVPGRTTIMNWERSRFLFSFILQTLSFFND